MRNVLFLFLLFLLILNPGCKSTQVVVTSSIEDIEGKWVVEKINNKELNPDETNQYIQFDIANKRITGNAGCNRFSGKIEYKDSKKKALRFLQIVSTRMACQDMSREIEMLDTLNKVVGFGTFGKNKPITSVALYGIDGSTVMVLGKR